MTDAQSREINQLIEDQNWDKLPALFLAYPDEAQTVYSRLGWTKLHWLCSVANAPPSLIDLVASLNPRAITMPDARFGDTPLHIVCRNSQTSARKLQMLLRHCPANSDNVLIRNRFGGTALHSASNHNAVLEALEALIEANPKIVRVATHEGLHAVTALWLSNMQTIPGFMIVARILEGEDVSEGHFDRFWKKCRFLAHSYFRLSPSARTVVDDDGREVEDGVLHGLIQCSVPIILFKVALRKLDPNLSFLKADALGNVPLHVLLENRPYRLKEREAVRELVEAAPQAAAIVNHAGDPPLVVGIRNKIPWANGLDQVLSANTAVVHHKDPSTWLYPFQLAAMEGGNVGVNTTYHLLLTQPDLINSGRRS